MVWRSRNDRARNVYNSSSVNATINDSSPSVTSETAPVVTSESSESEFVEEEKPWPPTQDRLCRARTRKAALRVPRPHSHLFRLSGGRCRGSKHTRRWENSMFLTSLHQIPEEELECSASILPSHHSPLSQLHCSDKHMQIWCTFTSRSEEEQQKIAAQAQAICPGNPVEDEGCDHDITNCLPRETREQERAPPTTEESFGRIESRIRAILQHNRHLPIEMVTELEEEIRYLFSLDGHAVVLVLQANPFCRLLLHGISQYMGLTSTTECYGNSSIVVVECRHGHFLPPHVTLSAHLSSKSR